MVKRNGRGFGEEMKVCFRALLLGIVAALTMSAHAETYVLQFGINDYPGTDSDLKGCVNDVNELKSVLTSKFGVKDSNVKTYLDAQVNKEAFLAGMQWVVDAAKAGDQVLIQYSGHGGQLDSTEEADGKDEVIVLADDTLVSGKFFNQIANDMKNRGIDVTFVLDSCFSGGLSRDPVDFKLNGVSKPVAQKMNRSLGHISGVSFKKVESKKLEALRKAVRSKSPSSLGGSFAFLMAASEDKPSADLEFKNGLPAHGAFTYILLAAITENSEFKLEEVMKIVQDVLTENKFDQGPNAEYSSEKRSEQPLVMKSN